MPGSPAHVAVLAPMPLEMAALVTAFGLEPTVQVGPATATGRLDGVEVTALHIGMGPAGTREAVERLLDRELAGRPVDHVMIAGICGGLDPSVDVGTLVHPELVIDHTTGAAYEHRPPGGEHCAGKLVTTEGVSLDPVLTRRFFEEGCVAVDMESSAVAEVCEARGRPWSVYRCIGDRPFDGLLDERIVALTNGDGSGRTEDIAALVAQDPAFAAKLERLAHDSSLAARRAAEAAVRGCRALAAS